MAKRKRKATLHSAGKVTEADLLERARALAQDPSPVLPHYEGGFLFFNPVTEARKGILRVHALRDDEAKLQRAASGGNDLVRAYAATLLMGKAEKLPFVADLRLPFGNVPYVIRGKAKPFQLAGMQHHHDRRLKLLMVMPWVKKRGLHFYSADRGIVCTGKRAAPPRDFVEEEMAELDLRPEGDARFTCGHADDEGVALTWRSANVDVRRCLACAEDENTMHRILEHVAAPSPARDFDVRATLAPLRAAVGDVPSDEHALPEAVVADYRIGRVGDRAVVEAARAARVVALRQRAGRLFVAGSVSYGADVEAFLAALGPSEAEARALRAGFAKHEAAVVVDRASTARVLAELWPAAGREMLAAAAGGDQEVAGRLHKAAVTPDEAVELVRRAARESASRRVDTSLPTYRNLPPVAGTADAIARTYRAQGPEAAVRVALDRAAAGKGKGVALAALTVLESAQGQEWRFSPSDQDIASTVRAPVERLLQGDPAGYHESLVLTSRLCGETTAFAPIG